MCEKDDEYNDDGICSVLGIKLCVDFDAGVNESEYARKRDEPCVFAHADKEPCVFVRAYA